MGSLLHITQGKDAMPDGEGPGPRRELTFWDLWNVLNELKNQWDRDFQALTAQVHQVERKVDRNTDRYEDVRELKNTVSEIRSTMQTMQQGMERRLAAIDVTITDLQSRTLTSSEKHDALESAKDWRQERDDSAAARFTRQNTLLAFILTFLGMGFIVPHLGDILRALVGK